MCVCVYTIDIKKVFISLYRWCIRVCVQNGMTCVHLYVTNMLYYIDSITFIIAYNIEALYQGLLFHIRIMCVCMLGVCLFIAGCIVFNKMYY